jgi:predicted metal-binding membrane protein
MLGAGGPRGDPGAALRAVLRRQRLAVLLSLAAVIALSWLYVLAGAGTGMPAASMSGLPTAAGAMAMMDPAVWSPGYAAVMLGMWWLMMVAMMLPSAAPALLLFDALTRRQAAAGPAAWRCLCFAAGYLTIWGGFSLLAVALQWALEMVALLSPAMVLTSRALAALLLVAAGIWQFTPLKRACLRRCKAPVEFLAAQWRPGALGAWRMGLAHGLHCLGCCWALMLLLFYGGVMNLYWIAGLALYVLAEKLSRNSQWLRRGAGLALVAAGLYLAAGLAAGR